MTIAVADSIHILMTFHHELRQGVSKEAAIREALRINASPVFLTTITTAIGVLSLNFSDSPPYGDLGNMVAVGVVVAYLLSMIFLPALIAWLPAPGHAGGAMLESGMDTLAKWVIKRSRSLLWLNLAVSIVLTSFLSRNELTERWHEYFGYSFELRHAIEAINDGLGGIHAIQYALDTGIQDGIHDPQYLGAVEAFAAWYRTQPGVAYVAGLTDVLKDLNKALHGSDGQWYRLPQERSEVAQYLLLHELSLPMGMGLDNLMNADRSATRLTVVVQKTDSETLLELDARARQWLSENAADILPTEGTSLDMIFSHINHRNIRSLLFGTGVALVVISLLLMIALRSVSLGVISLFPNLAPAAMAYGLWGLLVGHIDMALSVVVCMSLGIVVDDTVHFLSKYQRARKERQLAAAPGIRYAFRTVGAALTTTSVILIAGFAVLGASDFTPTRETGTLLAATLGIALVVDFLLLPPLLLKFDRKY
jgi:predicted RND superfamily exporter protein